MIVSVSPHPVGSIRRDGSFLVSGPMLKEESEEFILEVAFLKVRVGQAEAFEDAFHDAQNIISATPGYIAHRLQRCIEELHKYLLLVKWRRLEDHTIGFRQSSQYQEWKRLLHHFYDPFPTVEHLEAVFERENGIAPRNSS